MENRRRWCWWSGRNKLLIYGPHVKPTERTIGPKKVDKQECPQRERDGAKMEEFIAIVIKPV